MVVIDGYSLEYYPKSNQIVIQLPQTIEFPTNTVAMISNTSREIKDSDKFVILNVVKTIVEGGNH